MTPALEAVGLEKHFGALHVARGVTFALDTGARHALIGPNGAGKTTLVNLITGAAAPDRGTVRLAGEDITRLSEAARVKRGIARTFQITRLFLALPVLDNVALAVAERRGVAGNIWRSPARSGETAEEALELLDGFGLVPFALVPVRELPYGRQRLVEIAIALALKPKVLLLDEPAAGVPSAESHLILDHIAALPPDMAVLIIEHDMEVVFRFAERISVLVQGSILVEGPPQEIAADPRVRAVYLGDRSHG